MKTSAHSLAIVGTFLMLATGPIGSLAQSWNTVDSYQVYQVPGQTFSQARSVATDSLGRVFVAGYGFTNGLSGVTLAVRRSTDGGATWQTVWTLDASYFDGADRIRVHGGLPGSVFVMVGVGRSNWQGGPDAMRWQTYRSLDGGDSWSIVDDFALEDGFPSKPTAITSDATGNLYVSGYAWTSVLTSGKSIVRRSTDGGHAWTTLDAAGHGGSLTMVATPRGLFSGGQDSSGVWSVWRSPNAAEDWSLVDSFPSAAGDGSITSSAWELTADTAGNLFAAGQALVDSNDANYWAVRRSTDGGDTWHTIDDYSHEPTSAAYSEAVAGDSAGNLYVAGSATGGGSLRKWLVRSSGDRGGHWAVSDEYALDPLNRSSFAYAAASDLTGNVFVAGKGNVLSNGVDKAYWIVRKLSAPPRLTVALEVGQLRLTWSTGSSVGFVLQSATTLTNGGDWQDFPTPPTEVNGQKTVTITPIGPSDFFRLHRP